MLCDEEFMLMEHSFLCAMDSYVNVPSYTAWLDRQDQTQVYLYLKKTLQFLQWQQARRGGGVDTSYAQRFSDWVHEQLIRGDTEALLGYRQLHPDAGRAQPRDEHLLPLFVTAATGGSPQIIYDQDASNGEHAISGYMFQ